MRDSFGEGGPLRVKVIAGTYVVLMAIDVAQDKLPGLRGFAIKTAKHGKPQQWLHGTKYFDALVPNPNPQDDYPSRQQPFQSFLWSDYGAEPDTAYDFTIVALYGDIKNMEERYTLPFSIKTEPDDDGKHGVWFNRGAIASHAYATKHHNKKLKDADYNNVSADGKLLNGDVKWLSRGLGEAMLDFINSTKTGESLRVCAYEFTYAPVLDALKRCIDRGIDVEIIYHDTKKDKDPNRKAIGLAKLPASRVHPRTRTAIPHNKFIVKLVGTKPKQVWTGSTNFTPTGLFGQTNVGHKVTDDAVAATYLKYWTELKDDPVHSLAVTNTVTLTPNPPNAPKKPSITPFYSPRIADNMLDWYASRTGGASNLVMMTLPFNVAPTILRGLSATSDSLRLVILEDFPTKDVLAAEKASQGKLTFSNGALLGQQFMKNPKGGAKVTPIPNNGLDKWFIREELARPVNAGHVFFVHSKVLVIDALTDDPLVCSGSANFSTNSLIANDENMLLIRGSTRVADIYITEMDRIFRHFRARDYLNRSFKKGSTNNPNLLDVTDKWITDNLKPNSYKNNRRLLFFPESAAGAGWAAAAKNTPDSFADEAARAAAKKKVASDKAKARKAAAAGKPAKKAKTTKKVSKKVAKKPAKKKKPPRK